MLSRHLQSFHPVGHRQSASFKPVPRRKTLDAALVQRGVDRVPYQRNFSQQQGDTLDLRIILTQTLDLWKRPSKRFSQRSPNGWVLPQNTTTSAASVMSPPTIPSAIFSVRWGSKWTPLRRWPSRFGNGTKRLGGGPVIPSVSCMKKKWARPSFAA